MPRTVTVPFYADFDRLYIVSIEGPGGVVGHHAYTAESTADALRTAAADAAQWCADFQTPNGWRAMNPAKAANAGPSGNRSSGGPWLIAAA